MVMDTTVINVKINPALKSQAQAVAEDLGFGLSALIKAFLKNLVRTKTVTFSAVREEPSEYMIKALKESEADRKKGRFVSFDSGKKALKYLDRIIKNAGAAQKSSKN